MVSGIHQPRRIGGLRGQGWGVWLSMCVRHCATLCIYMCVCYPEATVSGVKHSGRDQRLGLWLGPHADSTEGCQRCPTDCFNNWLIDCLIDSLFEWFDCFLSLSGGFLGAVSITANWRNSLVNKLWLTQWGTTTILMEFLSFGSSVDEVFERTCRRAR